MAENTLKAGIDFDNTLVNYTGVFYDVAVQLGWIASSALTDTSKEAVKQFFIAADNEAKWTELQGLVYGQYILQAREYDDATAVMRRWQEAGISLNIISHKTRYPYLGEKVDLHHAARQWLLKHEVSGGNILPDDHIFFNETLDQKVQRINDQACDIFIDDLPKVLQHPAFPKHCRGILFDPDNHHVDFDGDRVTSWSQLESLLNIQG